jgi:exopolyphosphatase/guanosine-5'-triphosphate,3'-diphosphate pyrophosphatase
MIGAISQVVCEYKPMTREFHLKLKPTYANDDCALELWSLNLKKEAFEINYGLKLVAKLESKNNSNPTFPQ